MTAPGGIRTHDLKSFALQACALPQSYNCCPPLNKYEAPTVGGFRKVSLPETLLGVALGIRFSSRRRNRRQRRRRRRRWNWFGVFWLAFFVEILAFFIDVVVFMTTSFWLNFVSRWVIFHFSAESKKRKFWPIYFEAIFLFLFSFHWSFASAELSSSQLASQI